MRERDREENIYDRALESILNTRFNAPGWPIWMAFDDLPSERSGYKKEKENVEVDIRK